MVDPVIDRILILGAPALTNLWKYMQPRKIIVINEPSPHRTPMEQAFSVEGFDVIYSNSPSDADEILEDVKPDILLHDFTAGSEEEAKQYQLRLAKTPTEWDMPRVIVVEKITKEIMAFANDAKVSKVLSRSSSILAISIELGMTVAASQNLSPIQKDIRNMRLNPENFSDEDIDAKIKKAYEQFAHDPEVKVEFANLELKNDHLESAKNLAKELIGDNKDNVRAMNILARAHMKDGEFEKAIGVLQHADILGPNNTDRLVEIGGAFFQKGDLGNAKKYFSKAVNIQPKNDTAVKALGSIKITEGDAKAAIDLFRDSLSEEESVAVFNNAAVHAVNNGEFEKGLQLYESAFKCLKTDKYKPKVLFNLALAQKKSGNIEQAMETLEEVIAIDSSFVKAKQHLKALKNLINSGT